MNRRGFFAGLAALCAAPFLPKAPRLSLEAKMGDFAIDSERYHMPHECEWQDVPESAVQRCLYCRDVRSKMRAIEVDDYARHLEEHRRFVGMDSKTGKRAFVIERKGPAPKDRRVHWLF